MSETEKPAASQHHERQAAMVRAATKLGLLGSKDRQMGGRFSDALVAEAKRVSGITETTELLTYALIKVALEDDFGERLIARKGRVPPGTLRAD
jgi:hypothetical protein